MDVIAERDSGTRVCVGQWGGWTVTSGASFEEAQDAPSQDGYGFTDPGLTIFGGAGVLARTERRFGLFELVEEAASVKARGRGA